MYSVVGSPYCSHRSPRINLHIGAIGVFGDPDIDVPAFQIAAGIMAM
jgi:hypothetical protein